MNKNLTLNCLEREKKTPVTLGEVKEYLKLTTDYEDKLLETLILSVASICEGYTSLALSGQIWQLEVSNEGGSHFILPIAPARRVNWVEVTDYQGHSKRLRETTYRLDIVSSKLHFKKLPFARVLRINYLAGYKDRREIPAELKLILLSHIAFCFENRELPMAFPIEAYDDFRKYRL